MLSHALRRRVLVSGGILLGAIILGFIGTSLTAHTPVETAYANQNLIRLHIMANSNNPIDQDLKLKVRDAVLLAAREIFSGTATKDEAKVFIEDNWEQIKKTAGAVISAEGFEYDVQLQFGNFSFPHRDYGAVVLPEGHYDALRIIIGEGKGDNWWCVLFPPLCFVSLDEEIEKEQLVKVANHLGEGEFEVRSRVWDTLSQTAYAQSLRKLWQAGLQLAGKLN